MRGLHEVAWHVDLLSRLLGYKGLVYICEDSREIVHSGAVKLDLRMV